MTRRTASSSRWRQRQEKDPYVERAAREGWRSRAVFKLAEIDAREHVVRRGTSCVDLGAAPGAWSQYAAGKVGRTGKVWAVDLLAMDPIEGVEFFQGDFTRAEVRAELRARLPDGVDLVMSDMAPNLSGTRAIDLPRHMALAEEALAFAQEALKPGGDFLLKLFQGAGTDEFVARVRPRFAKVRLIKPKASRAESSEIYLLARQRRM
ncbi:MAG TPA: RlmE family RNA methyltransferase [Gammaproteobacteria bacterium]|jgi:23S rRNA (uridine2552-2'-O)-methyltransferase